MTIKEFIDQKLSEPARESHYGYHFITEYLENPYFFYIKYVLGFKPIKTGKALIFGGCIHDSIEAFYRTDDPDAPPKVFETILTSRREEYLDDKDYKDDLAKGSRMLHAWASKVPLLEKEEFEVVEIETQHEIPLVNGFMMTVRPDRVMRHRKSRKIFVHEVKTTGYSVDKMFESVQRSDQVTTYVMALSKAGIAKADDMVVRPEILYARGNVVKVEHPALIVRSQGDIARCEYSLLSSYARLYSSLKMLEAGYPAPMAFPYNGTSNRAFGHEAESLLKYHWLALDHMSKNFTTPDGFMLDERVVHEGLMETFIERWEQTQDYKTILGAM